MQRVIIIIIITTTSSSSSSSSSSSKLESETCSVSRLELGFSFVRLSLLVNLLYFCDLCLGYLLLCFVFFLMLIPAKPMTGKTDYEMMSCVQWDVKCH